MKIRVFVAMSGGVDSSVAALLLRRPEILSGIGAPTVASELKQKGYDLVGCFIKGWYPPGFYCSWKEDRRDAMRVCAKLGIPFITIDAEKEYKRDVVDYMLREYMAGRTPNPDVMCNKNIKFGVFLRQAKKLGADFIATGHYVKLKNGLLSQARDLNKDQSYFLWTFTQEQLKYCMFPIGGLTKPQVRELAKKNNLPTAEKEESMGVCFIGEFPMADFLKKYIKVKKGKVITIDGKIVGEHEGAMFYTIGQRHGGFSLGGGVPYYIVAKDIKKNLLIVADKASEEKFYKKEIEIDDVNWISGKAPGYLDIRCPSGHRMSFKARIRYRQPLQSCKIIFKKGSNKMRSLKFGNILVKFSKPQRAVTPGQSLVVYDGKTMLGGGVIK